MTVISFPYHYEGLAPVLHPQDEAHYEFILNSSGYPLRVSYFDNKGLLKNASQGWATYELAYDERGRLVSCAFYKANGKPAMDKNLKFARQTGGTFYNSHGKPLKSFKNDWIGPL
ncbi:MAG: hypothetical protein Q7T03_03270 [Deltaproteobacteria bacterium]|nr:hypothetical protein [Deltaproteobacteria bacterium]